MPGSMKAMVLERFGERLCLSARPVPRVGPNEALVRIDCCGVCGTDLKIVRGELPPSVIRLPHVPGHECAGEVVEVGEDVTGLKPPDAVVVYFYCPCRECRCCRQGRENICASVKRFGFELSGGYAEYLCVPARQLCPVRGISPREAAILPDAVATAYHAVKTRARVTRGERVVVVGGGGIGVHACLIARLLGAEVAVAEAEPTKLLQLQNFLAQSRARRGSPTPPTLLTEGLPSQPGDLRSGAWHGQETVPQRELVAFNPLEQDPVVFLKDWTRGDGVDVVIETVGSVETLRWSAPSLSPGGRLVLVGYDPKRPLQLDALQVHYRELEVLGTRVSTQQELQEVIRLVERRHLTPVIGRSYRLEEANEALRAVAEGDVFGRVVLDIGR